jgi:CRISPR-associated exonuclease Cas4
MPYCIDDLIQISTLQHALFCDRQYALIHLEERWEDNRYTAEGEVLHERVHAEHHESRKTYRQEYDMAVRSLEYGLTGKCDLVEIWFENDGKTVRRVNPVEFKRGHKKADDVDRVQLCGQALCLEELFQVPVPTGQLYYLQEHRRSDVSIDAALREKTAALARHVMEIRAGLESGERTPPAKYASRKCDNCSLVEWCMPKSSERAKSVARYVAAQIERIRGECAKSGEEANAKTA